MDLELSVRGAFSGETIRTYAERRFRFSLRRFGQHVKRLRVHIEDLNGPREGFGKCCRIVAEMSPSGNLVIVETDGHVREAVDRAANRFRQRLRRELERRQARELGKLRMDSIRYPSGWQQLVEAEI
jgi:ribosome hibernation promoting factor